MKAPLLIAGLGCACVAAIAVSLCTGPTGWRWFWLLDDPVIAQLRAPRVLLSGLVGGSLALSGVAMQALLRNDLAEPYVLGLSGGAAAGAVLSLAAWPAIAPGPGAAAGALCAASLVRALARGAYDPARLLLAGFAVSSLLASMTGLLLVLAPQAQLFRSSSYWLFGGMGSPAWSALLVPACLLVLAFGWLIVQAQRLDRLTLGVDVASSLGTDVVGLQRGILGVSVVLTAASVAASGLVGFVGLIAPHAARRLVGASHRRLLPVSLLLGALLVLLADTLARTAFAPREVPVGLLTAALGGPLFLWQLQRDGRRAVQALEGGTVMAEPAGGALREQLTDSLARATPEPSAAREGVHATPVLAASVHATPVLAASAHATPVLAASALSVGRARRAVLHGVELALQPGERVAVLGRNGSGKTTLLRALAGLDAPISGGVRWGRGALPQGAGRARVLGVLLQHEPCAPFKVRELVTLGLGLRGLPDAAGRRQVEASLQQAELSGLADRLCNSLSGGELQRVRLTRALVAQPRVLLLDEPTQSLDPARYAALVLGLDRLRGEVAVVLSTHELALAASCDRVMLLHAGTVAAIGTPDELLTPAWLSRTLGVAVERIDDPAGGAPRLRVLAPDGHEVAA